MKQTKMLVLLYNFVTSKLNVNFYWKNKDKTF